MDTIVAHKESRGGISPASTGCTANREGKKMKSCMRLTVEQLTDYDNGKTPPRTTKKIQDHLRVCKICSKRYRDLIQKRSFNNALYQMKEA